MPSGGPTYTTIMTGAAALTDLDRIVRNVTFMNSTGGAANTNPVLYLTYGAANIGIYQSVALAASASDEWDGWIVLPNDTGQSLRVYQTAGAQCDLVVSYADIKRERNLGAYTLDNFAVLVNQTTWATAPTVVPSPRPNSRICVRTIGAQYYTGVADYVEFALKEGATYREVYSTGLIGATAWDLHPCMIYLEPGQELVARITTGPAIFVPHAHWAHESYEVLSGA